MSAPNDVPVLRWGLLAAGTIAADFAAGVRASDHGELVAVGARDPERAAAFAAGHGIPRSHGSYADLLADPEVDAVYVSTPHTTHARWSIAALRAGKHVLCEKPVALDRAETDAVISVARRSGRWFGEGFMDLHHPQWAAVLDVLRAGTLGEIRAVQVDFAFDATDDPDAPPRLFDAALAGGGILDVGCYGTSVSRRVAGVATGRDAVEPLEVTGLAVLADGIDRRATGVFRLPGDVLATVQVGLDTTLPDLVRVTGTHGTLTVTEPSWSPGQRLGAASTLQIRLTDGGSRDVVVTADRHLFAYEVDAVARAVASGDVGTAGWAESLANMRTLDRWRDAVGLRYAVESQAAHSTPVDGRPLQRAAEPVIGRARFAPLDREVSRLVMGVDAARTPSNVAVSWDRFVELGGNVVDTGWMYDQGRAQTRLGWWMESRGVRDDLVVLDKGAHTPVPPWPLELLTECTPAEVTRQHHEGLSRLRTDHVDVFMLHRDNPDVPVGEFVDVLNRHVEAGTMRSWGVSNWTLERIEAANAYAAAHGLLGVQSVSNQFSLARWVRPIYDGAVSAGTDAFTAWLERTGTPLLPWSSQARGWFAGESGTHVPRDFADRAPGELDLFWGSDENRGRRERARALATQLGVTPVTVALAWVLAQPFPVFAIIGPRELSELESSAAACTLRLTAEQVGWLAGVD